MSPIRSVDDVIENVKIDAKINNKNKEEEEKKNLIYAVIVKFGNNKLQKEKNRQMKWNLQSHHIFLIQINWLRVHKQLL